MTRFNPYRDLQERCIEWARSVIYADKRLMWTYPGENIVTSTWKIYDLKERVCAADQLGYEVILEWNEGKGLQVFYRKRPDSPPGRIHP